MYEKGIPSGVTAQPPERPSNAVHSLTAVVGAINQALTSLGREVLDADDVGALISGTLVLADGARLYRVGLSRDPHDPVVLTDDEALAAALRGSGREATRSEAFTTPLVVLSAEGDTLRDAAAAGIQAAVATWKPPYRLRLHLGHGSIPSLRRWVTVTIDVIDGAS